MYNIAHLHMIYILRMELFLSNFPQDAEMQKILNIFTERKDNYKLFDARSNEDKL